MKMLWKTKAFAYTCGVGRIREVAQHEVEIVISKNGEVKVHIKGVKGKGCLEYAEWLTEIVGKVKDRQLTSEYYEPDTKATIKLRQELKTEE
jgi:hypothetical protein